MTTGLPPFSDQTPPQSAPALPGAHAIFDPESFLPALDARLAGLDPRACRAAALTILADARAEAMADIEAGFATHPRAARETLRAIAAMTDGLVGAVHHLAGNRLHAAGPVRLCLLAVGGYGRMEMAPHSDIDLLFLTDNDPDPQAGKIIETILYLLWDLKLPIGHATRRLDDCIHLATEDFTIRTSMLEHRVIAGDPLLGEELHQRLHDELFTTSIPEFIEAKLDERAARHARQGGQRYMLEPNIKEGKGGLRDLQTLYWIAKYIHGVRRAAELADLGVFARDEYNAFWQAEDFLWAIRCHLHLITGRATERLTFDLQAEVARRMGYHDRPGRRAVEYFMQDYFRHATRVGEITRVFLTDLESRHLRQIPMVERLFRRRPRLVAGFTTQNGRLAIADEGEFLQDPVNLLRLFDEGLRTGLLIHPDAMRLVVANLHRIDDAMRRDPRATRLFIGLLIGRDNPERALRRMNELGVLGAFIPEFQPIVAMMQFNHYHHYTVDEHSIQCVAHLAAIERGDEADSLPLTTDILRRGVNRRVLYLAMLLHDIGKGRAEDHAILGARIARRVCQRLRLPPAEVETVEWLVRHHLIMSDMAQKRDIGDPRTLRDFAKAVRSRERLDLLTVLTVCDIRGVGPGVWNNWKAVLLRQLHADTAHVLEAGLEEVNRIRRGSEARTALRRALEAKGWSAASIRDELRRHYGGYWAGLPTETHLAFARLLPGIGTDEIRIELRPDPDRDATCAVFAMADHPGIFSRLAGALALVGANVVDARTYTSRDGHATPVFWIQDAHGRPFDPDSLPRLHDVITRILKGEISPGAALSERDRQPGRGRAFRFPTHITFDNEGSDIHTIIEIDTRDRPGLLHDLTRTLAENNIQIVSAQIATYGAQVVDSFYVKDMFGLKLLRQDRRDALERKLRDAIRAGTERADPPDGQL